MGKDSWVKDDPVDDLLWTIDRVGQVHPANNQEEWEEWMKEKGSKLKCLIRGTNKFAIGVRFLGEQEGWGKTRSPLLWQGALLINKKSVATVHAEDFDQVCDLVELGITNVLKDDGGGFLLRIKLKFLVWKMRRLQKRAKQQIFQNLQ